MLGICNIAYYIPEKRINNYERKEKFNISDDFIENKLGIKQISRMDKNQNTSDLCCAAYEELLKYHDNLDSDKIDILIVCTQNPDWQVPHTAAIVHGKLGFNQNCAAFDISLGCSGYVYALSVIKSIMKSERMRYGLLFTADPYSKVIDVEDKNTSLLFGDAATVTYISYDPILIMKRFTFGTRGKDFEHLICRDNKLRMNGREIFNFAARTIPNEIKKVIKINKLLMSDIDKFLFHQGSKYITDFLIKRIGLQKDKAPFVIEDYGNTVSSSIPIMLQDVLTDKSIRRVLICGFGVGLSWASGILEKITK
jgi:3-oxoacyl-[acyl-carrier-protein] synthase-3